MTLVNEFLEDVFTPNSRTARTLVALLFRPGLLTNEYFSGRKVRYIQPIRLYLTTSILFFFFVSLMGTSLVDPEASEANIEIESETITVDIDWKWLTPEENEHLNQRLTAQLDKATRLFQEDPGEVRDMVIDHAPPVIFCLVPIFALLLKITYITKGRYYTEHLVFALHNHSFLFSILLLEALVGALASDSVRSWLQAPIDFWIPTYLLLSLKFTYGASWPVTVLKFIFLGVCYWTLFIVVAMVAALVGVMNL